MLQFVMTMALFGGGIGIAIGMAVFLVDRNDKTAARP
jgi:hypothetical protein